MQFLNIVILPYISNQNQIATCSAYNFIEIKIFINFLKSSYYYHAGMHLYTFIQYIYMCIFIIKSNSLKKIINN